MNLEKITSYVKKLLKTPYAKILTKVIFILLVVVSVLLNMFTFVTPVVKYYGDSMEPNIKNSQVLIVQKTQNVKAGDVIAFYYNNKVIVRRVICEGDNIINMDVFGDVYVNMEQLNEPYINEKSYGQCNIEFTFAVPSNEVFVMGDGREVSMDSRLKEIGTIPKERIIGKIIFSILPPKAVK